MKRIIALVLTAALVMSCGISSAFAAGNPQQPDSGGTDSGYTITVNGGKADVEKAKEGETVTITAQAPAAGKEFDNWETSGVNLDHPTETPTTFSMPANNVTVTATYENATTPPTTDEFDGKIYVGYPNPNGYVSIDTKDTAPASNYFRVSTWNLSFKITALALAADATPALKEALEIKFNAADRDGYYTPARFVLKTGKTLANGEYNVPITATVSSLDGTKTVPATFNVELHVNATDPAYIKTNTAFFDVADLNAPAATLTSGTITVASPSGKQIYDVKTVNGASDDAAYTVVNGKWDAAKKEYTFQLQTAIAKDGKYNFGSDTGVLVSFNPPKARMAYVPARIETIVRTADAKLADYVQLNYNEEIESTAYIYVGYEINNAKELPEGASIDTTWSDYIRILNFVSSPADAMFLESDNDCGIYVEKAGSATFDFDAGISANGLYKVSADNILCLKKGNKISSSDAEDKANVHLRTENVIDINNIKTYAVPVTAWAYDKNDKRIDITGVKLAAQSNDNQNKYFSEPTALTKDANGKFTFTLALINKAEELPRNQTFDVDLEFVTAQGTISGRLHNLQWTVSGGPKAIYFTKDNKKITKDTLAVGAVGQKYGIVVDGYKMLPGDMFMLDNYYDSPLTIVRGDRFYGDMNMTTEQITVRADRAIKDNDYQVLGGSLSYTAKIADPKAVLLTLPKNWKCDFSSERIEFSTTGGDPVVPPVTPPVTPPGNNNNNNSGSNSGSGSTGGTVTNPDKPSANVGSDGKVDSKEAVKEVTSAVADAVKTTANKTANVTIKNAEAITPAALKEIAAAAAKAGGNVVLQADSVVDGKIEARLYIDPKLAANIKADIKLGVSLSESSTAATKAKFKNFDNKMAVASFAQQGSFGMKVPVAIKADLTGLNTKTLVFYSYNKATNKYIPIANTGYYIDKNGFLHFNTTVGGEIIITDKPLVKKK